MQKAILTFALVLLSIFGFSQRHFTGDQYNRLGIQGGVTYGGIQSDLIELNDKVGFTAGFTTRANTYENFIVIYGVNFYQFNTGVMASNPNSQVVEEIDFKTSGLQINLFMGHKIIGEHLSIEAGPVLQLNGKWKPNSSYDDYRIQGYDITAADLEKISPVNFNVAAALSTGFQSFKFWFQYQYGVSNVFRKLNTTGLEEKDSRATNLKGRMGFATAGMVVYF